MIFDLTKRLGTSVGEEVSFDDRNDDVKAYLAASSVYTDANRANTSIISNYASTSIQDQDCPKPFLGHYNLTPNTANVIGAWTVTPFGYPPRMLKLSGMWNVRDCGGWACDGGKVRYGKLFRGSRTNNASSADLNLLAAVGIKYELDVRDSGNASGHTDIPNAEYRNVAINNAYATMITSEATAAATACIAAMEAIIANKPVYLHCASGADRTGCLCAMLEAILGMSDTDIDREFELTNFADIENLTGHVRSGGGWTGFWAALPTTQANAKMNVAKFLRDNGATTALLNSFRQAMIDGSPSNIDIPTWSVTNNLTDCTSSNAAASVDGGSSYSATITPASGYTMQTLTVTMGGADITSTAVSGNVITIASVVGNIVITAVAQQQTSYTNLVRTSEEVSSSAIYNGGLGYKNGYYISGDNEHANASDCMTGCIPYVINSAVGQPTDILYIKGYTGPAGASHTRLCCRKSDKSYTTAFNGFLSSNDVFDIEVLETDYYKLTPKSGIHHNYNVGYLQFSFTGTDGSNLIITKNEPIT